MPISMCTPCALANRFPTSDPHQCAGPWLVVDGLSILRPVPCRCPTCWSDDRPAADAPGAGGTR